MPCESPEISANMKINHIEQMLCQACRLLSIDEIKSLDGCFEEFVNGLGWYINHLVDDYIRLRDSRNRFNEDLVDERIRIIKLELLRMGCKDIQVSESGALGFSF